MRNLQQEGNPAARLYSCVNRIGAVTIARAALPQLARDLCVRDRDMASLIAQMAQRGQMAETGSVLHFSARPCVVKLGDILIDSRGSIIAGHGRYLASLKLGMETVPVIVLDYLSEIEKRAYLLADNKLADLSGWDDEALASELAELRDTEVDLGTLGFSDDELRVLLADAELPDNDQPDEEEIPQPPAEPVTRAGDIWHVGKHGCLTVLGVKR